MSRQPILLILLLLAEHMTKMAPKLRVVAVGAGIGGLAFAILARQRGLEVTVLERADELAPVTTTPPPPPFV